MNSRTNIHRHIILLLAIGSTIMSCQPEEFKGGNGLTDTNVDASFTITPIEGQSNYYILQAQSSNVIGSKWDIGEGEFSGNLREEVFIPDAGTYTISHTAIGRGGATSTSTQELIVAQSDPNAGNLIVGGKFLDADDHSQWTILTISGSGASWTYNSGNATITGGGWNQQGIYQAVEVQANKDYRIDMRVSGGGSVNTWFEVYVSTTAPVQNQDYTADGRRIGLSTWDGCANGPFDGKLSIVGCVGSGNVVNFDQDGTVYFVVKCGGENIGATGISMTNVEMRGI